MVMAALAAGLLAVACGDDDDGAAETPGSTATATGTSTATVDPNAPVIDITLNEWPIEPSVASIEAGPVTFDATNEGAIPHEIEVFVIGEDVDIADLPVEEARARPGEVGAEEIGEIPKADLPAGTQVAATFVLEPGRHLLICNIPGHYESGMLQS